MRTVQAGGALGIMRIGTWGCRGMNGVCPEMYVYIEGVRFKMEDIE